MWDMDRVRAAESSSQHAKKSFFTAGYVMKRNERGFITVEFLFAIVIAFGMSAIVFALTFTLSTVEVGQYIVFSTARAHAAANFDKAAQADAAKAKYSALLSDKGLASLFSNGWFTLSKVSDLEIRQGDGDNFNKDYDSDSRGDLQGVRTTFTAKILELRLPLIGAITPDNGSFSAKLTGILIREPTQQECEQYMDQRAQELWNIGEGRFQTYRKGEVPTPWEDNGC
jgi:hypothetical protein